MTVTHLMIGTLAAALGLAAPADAARPHHPRAFATVGGPAGLVSASRQIPDAPRQRRGGEPQAQGRGRGEPPPRLFTAPEPPQGIEASEPFSRTVRLAPDGTLDLWNIAGDIVVTGGSGDEVRINAVKRAWHETEAEARTLLREMGIRVIERGGTIEVRAEGPRRRDWIGSVEYTVTLPGRAHVTIRTVSGNVRVTNVAGELRAEAVSGSIEVNTVHRVRQLKTLSGDVQISNAEGQELTAATVSGNLTARNLKVHTIDMESVSGEMRLTDIESARARIRSINGPIDYRGRLARSGHYELVSNSGSIRIAPGGRIGFDLDASTVSGGVKSDLPLANQERTEPSAGRPGITRLRGTYGEAGAALSLRSFSGDILIAQP